VLSHHLSFSQLVITTGGSLFVNCLQRCLQFCLQFRLLQLCKPTRSQLYFMCCFLYDACDLFAYATQKLHSPSILSHPLNSVNAWLFVRYQVLAASSETKTDPDGGSALTQQKKVQVTFSEHSVNIQGTFREHSGNIQ
jgi:hypothetical protein